MRKLESFRHFYIPVNSYGDFLPHLFLFVANCLQLLGILSQEMDGNGSGFFRLKYHKNDFKLQGISQTKGEHDEYLTFLAVQPPLLSDIEPNIVRTRQKGHKSSIYVLTQVRHDNGKISVQRTDLTLKEWLNELERRRELSLL